MRLSKVRATLVFTDGAINFVQTLQPAHILQVTVIAVGASSVRVFVVRVVSLSGLTDTSVAAPFEPCRGAFTAMQRLAASGVALLGHFLVFDEAKDHYFNPFTIALAKTNISWSVI